MSADELNENRRALLEDLVEAHRLALRAVAREGDRLTRPCGAGRWTPAEHLLHLALMMEWVAESWGDPADAPRAIEGRSDLRLSWALLSYRLPDDLVAPERTQPPVILGEEELRVRLDAARDRLAEVITRESLERRADLPHWRDVTLARALRYLVVHARHHLRRMARGD